MFEVQLGMAVTMQEARSFHIFKLFQLEVPPGSKMHFVATFLFFTFGPLALDIPSTMIVSN